MARDGKKNSAYFLVIALKTAIEKTESASLRPSLSAVSLFPGVAGFFFLPTNIPNQS